MNVKRTATIVVVGGAFGAWLYAGATSGNRDRAEPFAITAAAIDSRGAALAGEIARLHERLRPSVMPRQPGRDLFSFVSRAPRAAAAVMPPAAPSPLTDPIARPAPPALQLSGITEDATPDGVVRTAILSGFGELFVAREGETIAQRFRVEKISTDVVELFDLMLDATVRLALR
ncbi:MAG: hypothetical protein ABI868_07295 [Acidobacteriota bacterium]